MYLFLRPGGKRGNQWDFRAACPPPYRGVDYFGADFLRESEQCVRFARDGRQSVETNDAVPADFAGKYIHVKNGMRCTTNQPSLHANRILLFGGSTIFCLEVPDNYTVASYLQRLCNKHGRNYLVENYGVISMMSSQSTERLLRVPIRSGDIVIFYEGVNDVLYPVFNNCPKGWLPGMGDGLVRRLNPLQRWIYLLALKYSRSSGIAKIFLRNINRSPPATVVNPALLKENLMNMDDNFRRTLIKANKYVRSKGGTFYHLLQPHIFTVRRKSSYEQSIAQKSGYFEKAHIAGYALLLSATKDLAEQGMNSYDLTGAFDNRSDGEEIFLDWAHCNHIGNELIAGQIYNIIFGAE